MDEAALAELFGALGVIRARRMFGGQGVYCDGRIFAIEIGGELFLKTDTESRPLFEAAGSSPFIYAREGRTAEMSYWRLPDSALDDFDEAIRWGRLALAAAGRAAARGGSRSRKKKPRRP